MLVIRDSLYYETGWEKRVRRNEKLKKVTYKIYHNMLPNYFTDI